MVVIGAVNHLSKTRREKNSKEQLALFDTGAGVSIIGTQLARSLGKNKIFQNLTTIRDANGNVMSTVGKIRLTLEIGGRSYKHELIISEEKSLTSQLILFFILYLDIWLNSTSLWRSIEPTVF